MIFRSNLLKIVLTMTIFSVVVRAFNPISRRTFRSIISRSASYHLSSQQRQFTRSDATRIPFATIVHNNKNRKINSSKINQSQLFSTTNENDTSEKEEIKEPTPAPITLLSGFLGAGKTSCLQNLLTNNEGIKIGIVVNDVASVNIDSKLLSNPNNVIGGEETVELQNGCACCSLADELLTSVEKLTDNGRRQFDSIVIELSGVADPVAVKDNWQGAVLMNHPATKLAKMDKVVTLIDSSTFGTDWMSWDASGDREGWLDPEEECAASKMVPELLSEQIEAADVLIINKIDLAGEKQVEVATGLAKVMNSKATVHEVQFGAVPIQKILGGEKKQVLEVVEKEDISCTEPDCTDDSHSHSHGHSHEETVSSACTEPNCTDSSHSHDHSEHDSACSEPECSDPTHDHSHSHDHGSACSEPECNDPTHDHSHSHDHSKTSTNTLGITNFVYKKDRPFDAIRLLGVLNSWPIPIKDELDLELLKEAQEEGYSLSGRSVATKETNPFVGVLRSKGFCWMAPTKWVGARDDVWRHNTAMYWSHAGKHFGISTAGKWWGTITKDQMKLLFRGNEKEYERIVKEDFVSEEFGDRRQEIVFIGASLDEAAIIEALDKCLCTDEEMEYYRQEVINFEQTTRTAPVFKKSDPVSPDNDGGPSLFDVGGTDNIDANIRGD